ncbi:transcription initiation factor TFIID subunit 6-like [Mercenaria mercenaria]|uniref:transcription initiation factor TFIID subunit 6-like n=1 Tax=Mercenaria mercenaria TaxID=6596 RepID=UPI00234F7674|nr:transcription initiation factor TFIID subunit 6-like [Mercenaria mercenaria]
MKSIKKQKKEQNLAYKKKYFVVRHGQNSTVENPVIIKESLIILSDELVHNAKAVHAFTDQLNFHNNVNNIQARITKTFSKAVRSEKAALATIYGALSGLGELGAEVINAFVLPNLKMIGERVKMALECPVMNSADRIAAENIKKIAAKYIPPVLKTHRPSTDTVEDYLNEFGYLGPLLHAAVAKERSASASSINILQKPTIHLPQQGKPHILIGTPGTVPGSAPQTPTSARIQQTSITIPRTPTTPNLTGNTAQKFVIMQQQRPGTPVQPAGTSLVKMLPTTVQTGQQSGITPSSAGGQKVVVMSLPQTVSTPQLNQQIPGTSSDVGMKSVFTTGDQTQTQVSILKTEPNT